MEKGDSVKEKRAGCALRVARYGLRVARCEVRSTGYGEMGLRWGGENCLFS